MVNSFKGHLALTEALGSILSEDLKDPTKAIIAALSPQYFKDG